MSSKSRPTSLSGVRVSSGSGHLHPALQDLDPATRFLYTPHTVTALLIGLVTIIYFSRAFAPPLPAADYGQAAANSYRNTKVGITSAMLVFLAYSIVQGPSTCMVRPHPAVWRLVHGLLIIYLLGLVFLLFQDVHDARLFLRHLFPELGKPLHERSYGQDCRLYIPGHGWNWESIKATVFDEFVVAHTVGWWAKALILRNTTMLWTLSIAFEFMELTFAHMLPNFNECWWDSWILDVLVCNAIGIYTGMKTVAYFGSREYNWSGLSQQPTLLDKAKRSLLQFTPHEFDNFDWRVSSSPVRCLQAMAPVLAFLVFEVNAFFLKYILWVPPLNPLNTIRLCLLAAMALPGIKEWYTFIESQETDVFNKLGPFAWLGAALMMVETLIIIKFGHGMFPNPWPMHVVWFWGITGFAFAVIFIGWSVRFYGAGGTKSKSE